MTASRYSFHKNTLDLVNGIHITSTFNDKITSPGDIYKVLPGIIENLYDSLGHYKANSELITTQSPTVEDLQETEDEKGLLIVFCIAPNTKTIRWHLHSYVYGVHQYNVSTKDFLGSFDRAMRQSPLISSSGKPIYYTAVTDSVDANIRKEGSLIPLYRYITEREHPSLIHYLHNKNSKDFLYHYVPASSTNT